jgi:hypothetical protein
VNRLGEANKGKSDSGEKVLGFNDVELSATILGMSEAA